jgi:hypothetical protein
VHEPNQKEDQAAALENCPNANRNVRGAFQRNSLSVCQKEPASFPPYALSQERGKMLAESAAVS